ncbi:MAG: hypothetical protein IJY42_05910 [Clostridia bacterium]|nr:hypothetical protein [Clostridia bacterium]MBQ8415964.1 hypothetical protein [Clostridia bacterium]
MKSLIATVLLLVLMLGAVVGNFFYINITADTASALLGQLPRSLQKDCVPKAEELLQFWESHAHTVTLSVGYTLADRVTEQAKLLLSAAECGDLYGYQTALTLLEDAISDMRRLEQFSIENLL